MDESLIHEEEEESSVRILTPIINTLFSTTGASDTSKILQPF